MPERTSWGAITRARKESSSREGGHKGRASLQHGDNIQQHCIVYLKVAKRIDLNILITTTTIKVIM